MGGADTIALTSSTRNPRHMSPLRVSRVALRASLMLASTASAQSELTPAGRDLGHATAAQLLRLLPDGEEKRRFILDCTGCHTFDARTAFRWRERIRAPS
jgi:hypothetical protein